MPLPSIRARWRQLGIARVDESSPPLAVLTPRHNYNGTARADYQISANQSATVRYTYNSNDGDNNGIGGYSLPSRGYNNEGSSKELQVTETAVLTPTIATATKFYDYDSYNAFSSAILPCRRLWWIRRSAPAAIR